MSVAITIRDVPEQVRGELAARASRAGQSLQEYVKGLLVQQASHPSADDWLAQVRGRVNTTGTRLSAQSILAARDADRS